MNGLCWQVFVIPNRGCTIHPLCLCFNITLIIAASDYFMLITLFYLPKHTKREAITIKLESEDSLVWKISLRSPLSPTIDSARSVQN